MTTLIKRANNGWKNFMEFCDDVEYTQGKMHGRTLFDVTFCDREANNMEHRF